jgi:hypothetical protein
MGFQFPKCRQLFIRADYETTLPALPVCIKIQMVLASRSKTETQGKLESGLLRFSMLNREL